MQSSVLLKRIILLLIAMLALGNIRGGRLACPAQAEVYSIEQVQQRLTQLGYYAGDVDGVSGKETATAVKNFQTANGMMPTGDTDETTVNAIMAESAVSKSEYLSSNADSDSSAGLYMGSRGNTVKVLQSMLASFGYFSGRCDGIFGQKTLDAVLAFQEANGMEETGIAGEEMYRKMKSGDVVCRTESGTDALVLREGDVSGNVKKMQNILKVLGFFSGDSTGNFGPVTKKAVLNFQIANGLKATGVADWNTLKRMVCDDVVTSEEYQIGLQTKVYRLGDTSDDIVLIQNRLIELGYAVKNTGKYDSATQIAIRQFQYGCDIMMTGDADGETRAMLFSGEAVSYEAAQEKFCVSAGETDKSILEYAAGCARDEETVYADDESFLKQVLVSTGVMKREDDMETVLNTGASVFLREEIEPGDVIVMQSGADASVQQYGVYVGLGLYVTAMRDSCADAYVMDDTKFVRGIRLDE